MRAGHFNLNEYLSILNESQEAGSVKDTGEGLMIQDGESKKAYDWLKKEYSKGKTEVKVEMKMGGQKFEPSMNFQTDLKSIKNFKSGIFGQVKTSDTEADSGEEKQEMKKDMNHNMKKEKKAETMKIEARSKKKMVKDDE